MRKVSTFILIISGMIFSVFVFNIILYAAVPEYRNAIVAMADKDADIPTVTSDGTVYSESAVVTMEEPDIVPLAKEIQADDSKTRAEKAVAAMEEEKAVSNLSGTSDGAADNDKPQIISKEYHEDCGTKKGYWVITYADGSVGIE